MQLFTQWTEYFKFSFVLPYKAKHSHTHTTNARACVCSHLLVRLRTFLSFLFSIETFVWWWIGVHRFICYSHSEHKRRQPYGGRNESSIKRSKRNSNKKINFVCLVCACDEKYFLQCAIFTIPLRFYIENTKGFSILCDFFPLLSLSPSLSLLLIRHVHCTEMIEAIVKKTRPILENMLTTKEEKANGNSYENVFYDEKLLAFQSFIGLLLLLYLLLVLLLLLLLLLLIHWMEIFLQN